MFQLNRSDSDGSMPLYKRLPFQRRLLERRSLRVPSQSLKSQLGFGSKMSASITPGTSGPISEEDETTTDPHKSGNIQMGLKYVHRVHPSLTLIFRNKRSYEGFVMSRTVSVVDELALQNPLLVH